MNRFLKNNGNDPAPTIHPRQLLIREEIRYLDANGWHILTGTRDERYCCRPEDAMLDNPILLNDAVIEQKKRDVF